MQVFTLTAVTIAAVTIAEKINLCQSHVEGTKIWNRKSHPATD